MKIEFTTGQVEMHRGLNELLIECILIAIECYRASDMPDRDLFICCPYTAYSRVVSRLDPQFREYLFLARLKRIMPNLYVLICEKTQTASMTIRITEDEVFATDITL